MNVDEIVYKIGNSTSDLIFSWLNDKTMAINIKCNAIKLYVCEDVFFVISDGPVSMCLEALINPKKFDGVAVPICMPKGDYIRFSSIHLNLKYITDFILNKDCYLSVIKGNNKSDYLNLRLVLNSMFESNNSDSQKTLNPVDRHLPEIIRLRGESEKQKGIFYEFDMNVAPIDEDRLGKVYRGFCVNERNGARRSVAIKKLYMDLTLYDYEHAKLEASMQLKSDNLVEKLGYIETQMVSDHGEVIKRRYIISEQIDGVTLYDVLKDKTKDSDGEDIPFAVKMRRDYTNDTEHFAQKVIMGVLSGLKVLHDNGYIHLCIAPWHIMLTTDGRIKLIDFGIAKQLSRVQRERYRDRCKDNEVEIMYRYGYVSFYYAAPEMTQSYNPYNMTTDLYSVGIMLYECIVGYTPQEGSFYDMVNMQLHKKIPVDKINNRSIRRVIAKACENKPDKRYQSCDDMLDALGKVFEPCKLSKWFMYVFECIYSLLHKRASVDNKV